MICNLTEASALLGYRSRSVLQRLVKAGHLYDYVQGRKGRSILVETSPPGLPSLQEAVRSLTAVRVGSPLTSRARKDWEAIAERCNAMLEPSLWEPPPWPSDRWAGIAGVLAMASAPPAPDLTGPWGFGLPFIQPMIQELGEPDQVIGPAPFAKTVQQAIVAGSQVEAKAVDACEGNSGYNAESHLQDG